MGSEGRFERFIDKIFSLESAKIHLIWIFLLGFILRFINALNSHVSADDMHFVTHAINFLEVDRLVTYDQSSGLWFAFTDFMFGILGMTQLSSRMAALIFGSFSILVIYLLTREFFSERVSLIAAFLLAVSPFHIRLTIAEMDVMAMFFVLMAMFLLVRANKDGKLITFGLSGLFLGLAIYSKVYPLLFIPSMLLYLAYKYKISDKEIMTKDNFKKVGVFLLVAFVFAIPALTHNYLLYQDKGFLDLQFTRSLDLGKDISAQYYSWDVQFDADNDWKGLIFGTDFHGGGRPTLWVAIEFIKNGSPLSFWLGLFGILWIVFYRKEKWQYLNLFILSIMFALPFLASIILLPKHFVFLELFIIPMAAFFVDGVDKKIKQKYQKDKFSLLMLIILLMSAFYLGQNAMGTTPHFYGQSDVGQMIEFRDKNVNSNDLVVADSRIYRGRVNWAFQGVPYLEGSQFVSLAENPEANVNVRDTRVYFVECVIDDCGWGTVAGQPEFNASMESLTEFFKANGQLIEEIHAPEKGAPYYPFVSEKQHQVNIYSAQLQIGQPIIQYALTPKSWFLYTIGYVPADGQFDSYQTSGIGTSLNSLALLIVKIALLFALISPFYVFYRVVER